MNTARSITYSPPKGGPPIEIINQRGSASRFHQPKGGPHVGTISMDIAVHLKKSRLPLCVHVQHNQSLAECVGGEFKKAQVTVLQANGGISHTPNW